VAKLMSATTTTTTQPSHPSQRRIPDLRPERLVREYKLWMPDWLARRPQWFRTTLFLVVLCVVSGVVRARYLNGQFWIDEGIAVGIAAHPLSAIPGILRYDGSPPLYYLLLHIWMAMGGDSEGWTHSMSLLCGLLTIPISYWGAMTLFNRRIAYTAAVLFAFNAFLTAYAQETRMYEMMALWGLLGTIGFLNGFVYRRRKYVILFGVSLALMLYTHAWSLFFGAGTFLSLIVLYRISDETARKDFIKDVLFAFIGAGVLFVPWLPTFIWQSIHTAAPWDSIPRLGAPVQLSRNLIGGDEVTAAFLPAVVIGLSDMFVKRGRNTFEARIMWMLIAIPVLTLLVAWLASHVTPAWVPRYFAPIVAPILFLGAMGLGRAGVVGAACLVLTVFFLMTSYTTYTPQYKSDVRDIAAEVDPMLHKGDVVLMGQPESVPLSFYYLPGGLQFANTMQGLDNQPSYMDWVNALTRYQDENPRTAAPALLNSLKPGQQLLYMRPLTEGEVNWKASWTQLIRRRSAQWGEIIESYVQRGLLKPELWAPHNYRGACCVAESAVLYKKL
jgi:mannosyltransferase